MLSCHEYLVGWPWLQYKVEIFSVSVLSKFAFPFLSKPPVNKTKPLEKKEDSNEINWILFNHWSNHHIGVILSWEELFFSFNDADIHQAPLLFVVFCSEHLLCLINKLIFTHSVILDRNMTYFWLNCFLWLFYKPFYTVILYNIGDKIHFLLI